MPEKSLTKEQKLSQKILGKLKSVLGKKKIVRLYVVAGSQKFWVKNPKKIIYYQKVAQSSATFSFQNKTLPSIFIKKVIYDDGQCKNLD